MSKKIYFTYGRFNAPTSGHEKLIDTLLEVSKNDDHLLAVTRGRTFGNGERLSERKKIYYLTAMYPNINMEVGTYARNTFFDWLSYLYDEGYEDIVLVLGHDRCSEFYNLATQYNGRMDTVAPYQFKNISCIEVKRDDDQSSSNLRKFVFENNIEKFMQICPQKLSDDQKNMLFSDIKNYQ